MDINWTYIFTPNNQFVRRTRFSGMVHVVPGDCLRITYITELPVALLRGFQHDEGDCF